MLPLPLFLKQPADPLLFGQQLRGGCRRPHSRHLAAPLQPWHLTHLLDECLALALVLDVSIVLLSQQLVIRKVERAQWPMLHKLCLLHQRKECALSLFALLARQLLFSLLPPPLYLASSRLLSRCRCFCFPLQGLRLPLRSTEYIADRNVSSCAS